MISVWLKFFKVVLYLDPVCDTVVYVMEPPGRAVKRGLWQRYCLKVLRSTERWLSSILWYCGWAGGSTMVM